MVQVVVPRFNRAASIGVAALLSVSACAGSTSNKTLGVPLDRLREQLASCRADSGPCQASIECTGTPDDRVCDASEYIDSAEAMRIARSNGIPEGIRELETSLVYNHSARRMIWSVENLTYTEQPGTGANRGGDVYEVDAVTGELIGKYLWSMQH